MVDEILKYKNRAIQLSGEYSSGPAQLSLAICLELFGKDVAFEIYQEFKVKYISVIHQSDFQIDFTLESFKHNLI